MRTRPGQLNANNVTLKRCITSAYGVGPREIIGGPDWLDSDRFEIAAKAAQPAGNDQELMAMLRNLLAERFKLALHRETRIIPAIVMEVARNGPKMERAEAGEAGTNTSNNNTRSSINAHNTGMDLLAKVLARELKLPVINHTALEGVFNFKLQWTPENVVGADATSIFTAIQEQLGLRLRSEKTPVELLVIDHVEKPSEN